jgi:hypothetical protein
MTGLVTVSNQSSKMVDVIVCDDCEQANLPTPSPSEPTYLPMWFVSSPHQLVVVIVIAVVVIAIISSYQH